MLKSTFLILIVQTSSITKLCKTSTVVTVNGMYPGPTIYAREDDRVVVKVTNLTPYNISIHWHGVRQRLTCWSDGPAYITQCPIQTGQSFTYRFALLNQRGTLFWHAHISWLRATVHGPLIIYPKRGVSYPFQPPVEEHVIVLGEYWVRDIQDLEKHVKESGGGPPGSDAYIFNGHPGPLHNCSTNDVYAINVTLGNKYLLRIINAALNIEHFFSVANHTMTVVETDGEYTKPFETSFIMLTPGQTYNVLITADQPVGKYYMAMAPYMPSKNVPFLNKTSYAILNYVDKLGRKSPSSLIPYEPILPNVYDTESVQAFSNQVKSLYSNKHWSTVDVPLKIDKSLFFAIGLNVFSCNSSDPDRCQGPNGGIFAASVNNVTFKRPAVSLLNAYYHNLEGYYSTDFPDAPEKMYDFVNKAPNNIGVNTQAAIGTQVSVLEYGWAVQVIFQDTGTVGAENHPIHLHGFSFYLLGTGLGNFNSSIANLNLYDPPYRNTVGVPVGGWAVIRFRADNPGIWFMHCHLEVHTTWGLSMAFLVKNGKGKMQTLPPPPPDLPLC
ncbi:Multicopper oxidase, type 1 [Corchorus olitorius]|uniref:Laccase n=1 Tax=Corchorus olitorius TaxID=93759 RepID=A0A1R3INY1_9ROSI|nr:Multicopper oxidase, type 1 [Corchorus olitorius]